MKNEAVILANGRFPQNEAALDVLRNAEFLCCCDGAAENLVAAGFVPDVIIGDGDSIPDHLRERFADIFIKVDEQDYNDMTKATFHCHRLGYRRLIYLGATGLREDHTIGNIFLLPFYLEELGVEPMMITDDGIFTVYKNQATFTTQPGQQLSIFNISCTDLTAKGLRWQLSPFKQLWQGTLNEATGHEVRIEGDGLFLVFVVNNNVGKDGKTRVDKSMT